MKSRGKPKIFQGQGKVSEFWSGKFGILLESQGEGGEIYIILDILKVFFTFIERLNKKTEKFVKLYIFSVQIAMFKVSEICSRSGKS